MRLFTIGLLGLMGVGGLYVADSVTQDSAMRLPVSSIVEPRSVLPQGWAYFTRSPREPAHRFYKLNEEAKWTLIGPTQNAGVDRAFGWLRTARAEAAEGGYLMAEAEAQEVELIDCSGDLDTCLAGQEPVSVDRSSNGAISVLCGDVAAVAQEPIPWAWSRAKSDATMPIAAVRFEVQCDS